MQGQTHPRKGYFLFEGSVPVVVHKDGDHPLLFTGARYTKPDDWLKIYAHSSRVTKAEFDKAVATRKRQNAEYHAQK